MSIMVQKIGKYTETSETVETKRIPIASSNGTE